MKPCLYCGALLTAALADLVADPTTPEACPMVTRDIRTLQEWTAPTTRDSQ